RNGTKSPTRRSIDWMKKKLKWIFAAIVLAFALLQFTNPPRINPPVVRDLIAEGAPPQIAVTLLAACYDCHSSETHWPWYSRIAPMSWQIAKDVNDGRRNLNLSDWPVNDPKRAAKKLEDMSEQIGYDEMPLKKYMLIHADARLTESQRKELIDWLDAEAARLKSSAQK
ncbi:MAG TPA: heme-binding domain-containing protein, partial [Verrucomicrobiae bacterium]|nr:heme-binding domain-containing protein [Verrucomicrobiae bacterium]